MALLRINREHVTLLLFLGNRSRKVWLLDPDYNSSRLTPYVQ